MVRPDKGMAVHLATTKPSRLAREAAKERFADLAEENPQIVLEWIESLSDEQAAEFGRRVLRQAMAVALEALRRRA